MGTDKTPGAVTSGGGPARERSQEWVEAPSPGNLSPGDVVMGVPRHGHPFFYEQTRQEEELHSKKNHDYAAGGDALGNFYRVAAILALYPGLDPSNPAVVAEIYSLKQLDATLWGLAKGIQHQVEGLHPRLQDRSVYAKIERCILMEQERQITWLFRCDACHYEWQSIEYKHDGCPSCHSTLAVWRSRGGSTNPDRRA